MTTTVRSLTGMRRVAFVAISVGVIGIALAYLSAFATEPIASFGPWLMSAALPICMVGMMTLGALREGGRVGALAAPFALVLLLVMGGFMLALALPPDTVDGPYWLGLPRRAAVIIYGVGLLPLFVLPLAYGFTFSALTLSDEAVDRVLAARVAPASQTPESRA